MTWIPACAALTACRKFMRFRMPASELPSLDIFTTFKLGVREKITSRFRIPPSCDPRPLLNREFLAVAQPRLRIRSIIAAETGREFYQVVWLMGPVV